MDPKSGTPILLPDSITHVPDQSLIPPVIICGSHGGWAAGVFAAQKGGKGVIFNDAGGGKDGAGITCLPWLQKAGIIGATVDSASAKIGVGMDTYESGVISHVNSLALQTGISLGMSARDAAWRVLREKEKNAPAGDPETIRKESR